MREGFIAQYTNYYQEMTELLLRRHGTDATRGCDREALGGGVAHAVTAFHRAAAPGGRSAGSPWIPAFLELKRKRERCRSAVNLLYVQRYSDEGREADFPARAAGPRATSTATKVAQPPKKPQPGRSRLAQQELAVVEDRLWKEYPRFMELTQAETGHSRGSAKRLLRPGEALLTYSLLKDKIAIFAVTPIRLPV